MIRRRTTRSTTMRKPLRLSCSPARLNERVAPDAPGRLDFSWSDARIARLQARGVRPILGLLHHGSGPAYTALDAADFAERFAAYAAAVAARN